jgi:hypothetical protein
MLYIELRRLKNGAWKSSYRICGLSFKNSATNLWIGQGRPGKASRLKKRESRGKFSAPLFWAHQALRT